MHSVLYRFILATFLISMVHVAARSQSYVWERDTSLNAGCPINDILMVYDGTLVVGTADSGIYMAPGFGRHWEQKIEGLGSLHVTAVGITRKLTLLAAVRDASAFRSTDAGASWSRAFSQPTTGRDMDITSDDHIYVASAWGYCLSTDDGVQWRYSDAGPGTPKVQRIMAGPFPYIFVAYINGKQARSPDVGHSWYQFSSGVDSVVTYSVAPNGIIYAGGNGLAFTLNQGNTWGTIPFDGGDISCIGWTPAGEMVISHAGRVSCSFDGGYSWESFDRGISNDTVRVFLLDRNRRLLAGTSGGHLYRLNLASEEKSGERSVSANTAIAGVTPHPISGTAAIRYTLPSRGDARLGLYDVMGNEALVLANGPVEPGAHVAYLDAASLPSGTYLLRLRAGSASVSRPVVVAH